jgi:hypothetical protein
MGFGEPVEPESSQPSACINFRQTIPRAECPQATKSDSPGLAANVALCRVVSIKVESRQVQEVESAPFSMGKKLRDE